MLDDNQANVQIVCLTLRKNNLRAVGANNAQQALELIEKEKPDLILLDIMMPDIDGYKFMEMLKQDDQKADIPVIFLTAKSSTEDIVKGLEIGAVDYMTKPFSTSELITRINTHVKMKRLQDALIEKKQSLEALNMEMNEIIGIMAHDLKNPIFSILMQAKSIKNEQMPYEEAEDFIDGIIRASDVMLELIKKILEVNHVEQGKMQAQIKATDITQCTSDLLERYEQIAKNKNITLNVELGEIKMKPLLDENLYVQVLDNLVSNAVKYSPNRKRIWVKLECNNGTLDLSVKDEGPGLSKADQEKMYSKFCKLTPQPTGHESSTGLGLSIVKKYVDMMNASISLESEEGNGCNFIVKFPLSEEKMMK